jgi:hypothetical protein
MFITCVVGGCVTLAAGGASVRGALVRDAATYAVAVLLLTAMLASGKARPTARKALAWRESLCAEGSYSALPPPTHTHTLHPNTPPGITETRSICLVLFGMQNRTFGPYLAAINRITISVAQASRRELPSVTCCDADVLFGFSCLSVLRLSILHRARGCRR